MDTSASERIGTSNQPRETIGMIVEWRDYLNNSIGNIADRDSGGKNEEDLVQESTQIFYRISCTNIHLLLNTYSTKTEWE